MSGTLTVKGRETKRRIVDVAVELFHKEGFDNVSIARICEAAQVSNGSFFHYFKEKEDILYSFVEDESDELVAMKPELDEMDAQSALDRIVDWQCNYYEQKGSDFLAHFHSHLIASRRTETFKYAFVPIAASIIERGQKEGIFRKDIEPLFAATLLFVLMTKLITYAKWPDGSDGTTITGIVKREYRQFLDQVLK